MKYKYWPFINLYTHMYFQIASYFCIPSKFFKLVQHIFTKNGDFLKIKFCISIIYIFWKNKNMNACLKSKCQNFQQIPNIEKWDLIIIIIIISIYLLELCWFAIC